jgi:hypothetical protein
MKLYEFFGVPTNEKSEKDQVDPRDELSGVTQADKDKLVDDVYWYILDHDQLHKDHFIPLAREIAEKQKSKSFDHGKYVSKWMPLVNKGCMEFYKEMKMTRDPKDIFPSDMRKALCHRLADQHHKDIEKEEYKLGK